MQPNSDPHLWFLIYPSQQRNRLRERYAWIVRLSIIVILAVIGGFPVHKISQYLALLSSRERGYESGPT